MKKIDILMATYNGENYIVEQIESILNQTYKNFNLIISDDASTDNTLEILKQYEKLDDRVIVYSQEKNLGIVKNFEFLLKKVENEFFMLADQDDVWDVDKVEISYDKMEAENSDLVYTDLKVVDDKLNVISNSYWRLKGFDKKIKKYNNFESLYLNNYITGCTILCKSKWIDEILPLPKESKFVIHDYWIALIVSMKGRLSYIEQPLIKYRQHTDNTIGSKKKSDTIKKFEELRKLFITVKKQHFEVFVKNNEIFSDEYKKLNQEALNYFNSLESTNKINFKKYKLFFKLYKYENFIYKMENFVIINIPCIGNLLFRLKGNKNGK